MVCVSSRKKEKRLFLFLSSWLDMQNVLWTGITLSFFFAITLKWKKSPLKERKLLLLSLRDALDGWIDGGKVSDISYRYSWNDWQPSKRGEEETSVQFGIKLSHQDFTPVFFLSIAHRLPPVSLMFSKGFLSFWEENLFPFACDSASSC